MKILRDMTVAVGGWELNKKEATKKLSIQLFTSSCTTVGV